MNSVLQMRACYSRRLQKGVERSNTKSSIRTLPKSLYKNPLSLFIRCRIWLDTESKETGEQEATR